MLTTLLFKLPKLLYTKYKTVDEKRKVRWAFNAVITGSHLLCLPVLLFYAFEVRTDKGVQRFFPWAIGMLLLGLYTALSVLIIVILEKSPDTYISNSKVRDWVKVASGIIPYLYWIIWIYLTLIAGR